MAQDSATGANGRRCRLKRISLAYKQMNLPRRIILLATLLQTLLPADAPVAAEPLIRKSALFTAGTAGYATCRILLASPHNPDDRQRKNVTVELSYDEGKTWPVARYIEPGGYSDLAVGPEGSIYCSYERGSVDTSHCRPAHLTLVRFNLEWPTSGADKIE